MTPKVSVLVAVYNTADYLPACLNSLLNQSLHDIEVICVDDASTDSSLKILRQYAMKDPRVQVISLDENKGQAHVRNVGLSRATGEYIAFVDSDDWLSLDALSSVVKAFDGKEVDSVLFHLVYTYPDGHTEDYPMPQFTTMTGEEGFRKSLTWAIHGCYVVHREIHKAYPYDESQRAYSDDNTTRIHYYKSRRIALCEGIYYYRQQAASVTHAVSVRRFDYLLANESMHRQLLDLHVSAEILALYETERWLNLVGLYFFYYRHRRSLSPSDRRRGLNIMHHVWATINLSLVRPSLRRKFGYHPFHRSWLLFRLQEELYFWLRGIIKGLPKALFFNSKFKVQNSN